MKQKFFTLLLGLAMVSVNALAVEISISKKYGATTYVCNQDLDFSTVATSMRPYYIIEYAKNNGNFKLEAFNEGKVPANTPMILIGKQYPTAGASDVITCDVPVATSIDDPDGIRKNVFTKAQGWAWLMPVINGNYTCPNFNAELADRSNDEKAYNVTFFNYSSGAARVVPQTESVPFGEHLETNYTIANDTTYYDMLDVTTYGEYTDRDDWKDVVGLADDEELDLTLEIANGYPEGADEDYTIFYYPKVGSKPRIAALFMYSEADECWTFDAKLKESAIFNYNKKEGKWIKGITPTVRTTDEYVANPNRSVYNYVLSVNSSGNPVFKLCNSVSGTTVPYGKCYVSVWSDVKAAASSREDIGIEFVEDEEDLSELNEEVSGIKNVNIKKEANGIYNINGQKLVKLQKGLNIVNGKKVYVK